MTTKTSAKTTSKSTPKKRFDRDGAAAAETTATAAPEVLEEMRALVEELRTEREALERARAERPQPAPTVPVIAKREPVDLGPWPQRIMTGGLAAFTLLVLLIAFA